MNRHTGNQKWQDLLQEEREWLGIKAPQKKVLVRENNKFVSNICMKTYEEWRRQKGISRMHL
jgi:hypothetical protein